MAYIAIYADAPTYKPVVAGGEGITCVDDVGRFLEVLERCILEKGQIELVPMAAEMTEFLLYMARPDGLWYNFLLANGSINTEHQNSYASFGWWAVRGLRGLAAADNIFDGRKDYRQLVKRIETAIHTADNHIDAVLARYPQYTESEVGKQATWLLNGAADQTSELLLVLTRLHQTGDFDYYIEIRQFALALQASQLQETGHKLDGMYYCWQNVWHGWGNNQAYALAKAYQITREETTLISVRRWADTFVPYLIGQQFPRRITLNNDLTFATELYPQIAYGINSTYQGLRELATITGEKKYLTTADQVFDWFNGNNTENTPLYDPATGRCYDGINGAGDINFNSGAESTIECLLAVLENELD